MLDFNSNDAKLRQQDSDELKACASVPYGVLKNNLGVKDFERERMGMSADADPSGGIQPTIDPISRAGLAYTGQNAPNTLPNSDIPSNLAITNDPRVIRVLFTRSQVERNFGEENWGNWVEDIKEFTFSEMFGDVSHLGDFNTGGSSGATFNYPQRDAFYVQTNTKIGVRQQARWGMGRVDYESEVTAGAMLALSKFRQKSYLFGVKGRRTYGVLNDPALQAPVVAEKGKSGSSEFANKTAEEITRDVIKMYNRLSLQIPSYAGPEATKRMIIPTDLNGVFGIPSVLGNQTAMEMIQRAIPNLEIREQSELGPYGSQGMVSQNTIMMYIPRQEGSNVPSATCAFPTKLIAFPVVNFGKYKEQCRGTGTWGGIWFRPLACTMLTGV